jgi:DNA-binding NarL/FixJ family response regulator
MQLRAPDRDSIRVLLGPMPDLLRDMIKDLLSSEKDMVVLGNSETPGMALITACSEQADMLIVQAGEDGECGLLDELVRSSPFSIFAISASGTDATAINLIHQDVVFDASSRTAFAAAIRSVARPPDCGPEGTAWPA